MNWRPQHKDETEAQYEARVTAHWARVRVRTARARAKLRVYEEPDPSECPTGASLPPRAQVPSGFQPKLPSTVQKAAALADRLYREERARMTVLPVPRPRKKPVSWVTGVPTKSRRHRATGKRKGRSPNADIGLAVAVHALAENRGIDLDEAKRQLAEWLVKTATVRAGKINFSSAMNRIRKALLDYYRYRILKATPRM